MANFIESMGYSLGKVHIGLIAYMCNLYRGDRVNVLKSFLQNLNISVPEEPVPIREWSSGKGKLDLAIFNGKEEDPCIIIEMKIDDYEADEQLEKYKNATEHLSNSERLLITLGNGEYYRRRDDCNGFTWIRLGEFAEAAKIVCSSETGVLHDWAVALENELKRRDDVRHNARKNIRNYRPGSWNITLLGQLNEELSPEFCKQIDINPTCKTWGPRPDTILHFGSIGDCGSRLEPYTEINRNGKLNVKAGFNNSDEMTKYRDLIASVRRYLLDNLDDAEEGGIRKNSRSTTLVSLPVHLQNCDDDELRHEPGYTKKDSIDKLTAYLKKLHSYEFRKSVPRS